MPLLTNSCGERFSFTKRGCICPETVSQTFHALVPKLGLHLPPGVSRPDCMTFGIVPTPRSCRLLARRPYGRRSRPIENRHNQRLSKNANSWSSGRYRPGLTPRGCERDSACSFNFMSACRYIWVVSTDSCPSHSAITARSTPFWRRSMAAECRSACGLTFFRFRDRHFSSAMEVYFSTRAQWHRG